MLIRVLIFFLIYYINILGKNVGESIIGDSNKPVIQFSFNSINSLLFAYLVAGGPFDFLIHKAEKVFLD